jgi:hypothetical protein
MIISHSQGNGPVYKRIDYSLLISLVALSLGSFAMGLWMNDSECHHM